MNKTQEIVKEVIKRLEDDDIRYILITVDRTGNNSMMTKSSNLDIYTEHGLLNYNLKFTEEKMSQNISKSLFDNHSEDK